MEGSGADTTGRMEPGDAFGLIAHETRIDILRVLATTDRAERPVEFSEILDQIDGVRSAKFNYHLNELKGQFVERTDEGYDFRRPGRRVAQAILSGAVTGNRLSELTDVEQDCHHCDGSLEVMYHDERIAIYCADCSGTYASSSYQDQHDEIPDGYGFLGLHDLPPAGMAGHTPTEALEEAHKWALMDTLSMISDSCPRCSSRFDWWVDVCEDHRGGTRCCDRCGYRHAVVHTAHCQNCTFDSRLPYGMILAGATELQSFLTSRGFNLLEESYRDFSLVFKNYEEEIIATDPLEVSFTFTLDGDDISLTVDGERSVLSVST